MSQFRTLAMIFIFSLLVLQFFCIAKKAIDRREVERLRRNARLDAIMSDPDFYEIKSDPCS